MPVRSCNGKDWRQWVAVDMAFSTPQPLPGCPLPGWPLPGCVGKDVEQENRHSGCYLPDGSVHNRTEVLVL